MFEGCGFMYIYLICMPFKRLYQGLYFIHTMHIALCSVVSPLRSGLATKVLIAGNGTETAKDANRATAACD